MCAGGCLAAAHALTPVSAIAAEPAKPKGPPQYEISGGAEIAGPSWSAYSTTVVALSALSKSAAGGIREDGWRLRAGAGYWRYSDRVAYADPPKRLYKNTASFADLLIGYHKGFGELTVKAYAGIAYSNEMWLEDGANNNSPGANLSAKLLIESWLNLTPKAFAQLDAGWTNLRDTITLRARIGYRALPSLSVGPEVGYWSGITIHELDFNRADAWRYGAFVRFEWNSGEVSLSAGVSDEPHDSHFYATLNALLRF